LSRRDEPHWPRLSSASTTKGFAMKSILALLAAIVVGVATYLGTGQADPPKNAEGKKDEVQPAQEEKVVPAGALARLGWDPLRLGHFSGALTPDGKKVVTLSTGAVVHIFEAATGRLLER